MGRVARTPTPAPSPPLTAAQVVDDEDDELLPGETATMIQESIKPWDSISNVIPAPTVVRAQPNYGRPGYNGGPPLPR